MASPDITINGDGTATCEGCEFVFRPVSSTLSELIHAHDRATCDERRRVRISRQNT